MSIDERMLPTPADTLALGAELARVWNEGDVVLLVGELGAGKTTLVRGLLAELGFDGPVRSPTFNLLQIFPTQPPVLHADLYRVESAHGIGLEDYLDSHLCLIEWPDRLGSLVQPSDCWRLQLLFEGEGRRCIIRPPEP